MEKGGSRKKRYLEKIELGEERLDLVNELKDWKSEVEKLACFKAYQEIVEILFDLASMLVKDKGKVVEDDYTNLIKLTKIDFFSKEEVAQLKEANRTRNWIVHRYNQLSEAEIKEALPTLLPILDKILEKFKKEVQ